MLNTLREFYEQALAEGCPGGVRLWELVGSGDREPVESILDRVIQKVEIQQYDTEFDRPDGTKVYFSSIASHLVESGRATGTVVISRDVTKRKQDEQKIKQQQYYLEKAQELGQIGTWELDLIRNRLHWTDENCRIFGVPPGSVATYEVFIGRVHPDDREYVDREWNAGITGKPYDIEHRLLIDDVTTWVREKAFVEFDVDGVAVSAVGTEFDMIRKDGTNVRVSIDGTIGHNSDGSFKQTHCVLKNITAQKRAEEEQRQLEAQMQQSQKLESLGVMAGGIAHDFNNILYVILGNADIALMEMPSEAAGRDNLQKIQTAARRASGLTDQMLAYSGKGVLVIERIDLSPVVREMAHLLEVSHSKKAIVKYRFSDTPATIEGDASQLRQVVMNLITNASEAIGEESGAIDIQSEVGRGTTAKVRFPVLGGAGKPATAEAPLEEKWAAHGSILVVDDEPQIRNLTKTVLERKGFMVLTAGDGRGAVEVFEEHQDEIVCVLLDLTMPHMGGDEAVVELHRIREDVPVVLVSGYSEKQLKDSAGTLGFAGFLKKPVRNRELLEKVRNVLML